MVTGKQPEESPPIDDVPGMAAAGLQLHQAVLSEPGIEVECAPYQQKGRQDTECDAGPLSHSGHVHDYEITNTASSPPAKTNRYILFNPLNSGLRPIPLLIEYSAILQEE